ncbi:MAG: pyridoxamine 5'-phosphate oxidase, partial [Candidatus Thermoplasmatota archaeon]|nr:pyridoxamine 5'-phosphate oxidase [Candidatus Thermoplasmatota archaeon]
TIENYDSQFATINLERPLQLLADWLQEAKDLGITEPDAMNLATVDKDGNPHNRMVLMRHINEREIGFFTNLESDKASDIYSTQRTSSTLWWPQLSRQVRIEGTAVEMPRDMVEEYYQSRPRNSKIAAWSSKQSKELASMDRLHEEFRRYEAKFSDKNVPTPLFWGGFRIQVDKIEYWYGKPFRLHERVVLTKEEDCWSKTRIYP